MLRCAQHDLITGQTGAPRTDLMDRVFPLGAVFDPATSRAVTKGQVDPVTGIVAPASGFVRDPFYEGSLVGVTNFTPSAAVSHLNIIPSSRLDPKAIKLLGLYPTPNGAGIIANLTNSPVESDNNDSFDMRLDHDFSGQDTMFGGHELTPGCCSVDVPIAAEFAGEDTGATAVAMLALYN